MILIGVGVTKRKTENGKKRVIVKKETRRTIEHEEY